MKFKDYYAALGVAPAATQDEIKRAYRKLARKYHPDVSKEPDAEAHFKDVAEAHQALIDPGRRAAYDELARRHAGGQAFEPPPGWDGGRGFGARGPGRDPDGTDDFGDFFESMFGAGGFAAAEGMAGRSAGQGPQRGRDHHAALEITLQDAYRGAQRTISLRVAVADAAGQAALQERRLEVGIPKGVRDGRHLRLAGQGAPGREGGSPGDLYLEIRIQPDPVFRLDGADVYVDLPVAPWEAALGAPITVATPEGSVHLSVPPGSSPGRKLRLKGRGLPGTTPGDLFAVLSIALPPAASDPEKAAYAALSTAFASFNPRAEMEHRSHD